MKHVNDSLEHKEVSISYGVNALSNCIVHNPIEPDTMGTQNLTRGIKVLFERSVRSIYITAVTMVRSEDSRMLSPQSGVGSHRLCPRSVFVGNPVIYSSFDRWYQFQIRLHRLELICSLA